MKKKIYGMLVVLSCPIILNTQQVFAEELPTNDAAASAVVEEIMAEALMTVPEAVTESFTEPVTEESTEATEESTTVDSSTEVTEETTTSETPVTEESTEETTEESITDDSVELPEGSEELPVEDVVLDDEVAADTLTAEDEIEAATSRAAIVSTTLVFRINGAVVGTEVISGEEGEIQSIYLSNFSDYTVSSVSDNRFSVLQIVEFPVLQFIYTKDFPELFIDFVPKTTVGVFFNLRELYHTQVKGGYETPIIYQENGESSYTYTPPVIEHYDYVGPEVITGEFDPAGMKTVDLQYYKRKMYNLTVEYVDEFGNHLGTEVFSGTWGYGHELTPASFAGRTLISIDGQPVSEADLPFEIFSFPKGDTTMTVVYTGILETPAEDPLLPEILPGTQGSGAVLEQTGQENLVPLKTIQPVENKKVTLPETGEETNTLAVVAGTALFLQAGYMMLKKKKESEG